MASDIPARAIAADGLNWAKGQVVSAHAENLALSQIPYISGEDAHGNLLLSFAAFADLPGYTSGGGSITLPITIADVTDLQTTLDDLQAQIDSIGGAGGYAATHNTWLGDHALGAQPPTGADNTAVGFESLKSITSGTYNTAVGSSTMPLLSSSDGTTAKYNTACGHYAGNAMTSGYQNTLVGSYAGYQLNSGHHNTLIGVEAGGYITSGTYNVLVGHLAAHGGGNLSTGTKNTLIGYNTGASSTASYQTAIGADAVATQDNTVILGRTTDDVGIGMTAPQGKLHVDGRIHLSEIATNPAAASLTSGSNVQDRVAIYTKANKLVVAYNLAGTVNYLTFTLDGATTTFTNDTTAP